MTEQELVQLLRQQPERGLSLLIDRYTGLVLAVLRAKGGNLLQREDLEELASDCFLAVYDMRERIDLAKGSPATLRPLRRKKRLTGCGSLRAARRANRWKRTKRCLRRRRPTRRNRFVTARRCSWRCVTSANRMRRSCFGPTISA